MSNYKVVADPWAEAMNPPELPQGFHGKITVEAYTVMFVEDPATGKKMKVPYDSQTLLPDGSEPRPVSVVKLGLIPVNENLKWDIFRELIVTSSDWTKITLPSIKDVGIMSLKDLDGKYAEVVLAETGRTYQSNGETKQATTFKFVKLFPDEASCKAAAGISPAQVSGPASAPASNGSNQANGSNPNGSERATALKFAKVYVVNAVRAANKDLDKTRDTLAVQISQQALLSKYFTVDSPEVVEMMMEELAK